MICIITVISEAFLLKKRRNRINEKGLLKRTPKNGLLLSTHLLPNDHANAAVNKYISPDITHITWNESNFAIITSLIIITSSFFAQEK